ncbi:MAG: RsmE family RNA methyltransferase [Actinomycetota bacterium]
MRAPGAPHAFAATAGAAAHVLVGPGLAEALRIEGPDGHHLERVRRLRVGERVTAGDGAGAWRPYRIVATARGRLDLAADGVECHEPRLTPGLGVAFGIGKGTKPEQVVAGLTELGVDRIVPLASARSVARWEPDRADAALARLRRVAREAAMQCRRARVPEVAAPVAPADLAPAGTVVLGDPDGVAVDALPEPGDAGWLAVVGAEGGWDADERAVLLARPDAGALAVGPHVLRTETAALAVAAALAGRRRPSGAS